MMRLFTGLFTIAILFASLAARGAELDTNAVDRLIERSMERSITTTSAPPRATPQRPPPHHFAMTSSAGFPPG